MRNSLLAASLIACFLCAPNIGCRFGVIHGSGVVVTETRDVGDFSAIECSGSAKIIVNRSDEVSIVVTCDDNLLEHIETNVTDGTLDIHTTSNISPSKQLLYEISCPKLTRIKRSGSGSSELNNLEGALTIRSSGSGKTKLVNQQGESLDIKTSGSGGVSGSGSVQSIIAKTSGSGSHNLADIKATTVDASTSGSGSITVDASEAFHGRTSGSGSITVHGNPAERDMNSSGSGRVKFVE